MIHVGRLRPGPEGIQCGEQSNRRQEGLGVLDTAGMDEAVPGAKQEDRHFDIHGADPYRNKQNVDPFH
ncbi:hypothetical protein D3C73_1585410 [compost metagenome]